MNDYLKNLNKNIKAFRESKKLEELLGTVTNTLEEALKLGKEISPAFREKVTELCKSLEDNKK